MRFQSKWKIILTSLILTRKNRTRKIIVRREKNIVIVTNRIQLFVWNLNKKYPLICHEKLRLVNITTTWNTISISMSKPDAAFSVLRQFKNTCMVISYNRVLATIPPTAQYTRWDATPSKHVTVKITIFSRRTKRISKIKAKRCKKWSDTCAKARTRDRCAGLQRNAIAPAKLSSMCLPLFLIIFGDSIHFSEGVLYIKTFPETRPTR